jgi:hypothetical protein
MKARIILALAILGPFFYILFYVYDTATDLAFRDDMYLIKGGFIESFCKGTLTLSDLWRPAASNRMLGYSLVQLANIKWFGMNNRFIVLMIPFLMLISAFLIYRDYKKSLAPERSQEFIAATFVFLALILFNIIQWEGLTFGYAFVFQSPMPFFIATFVSLEALVEIGRWKWWLAVLILSILAILVFGGTHSFSFALALGATFICYILTRRKRLPERFYLRTIVACLFLSAIAFLYLRRIHDNDYFPGTFPNIDFVVSQPFNVIQFLFAAFGSSVVGVDVTKAYFSFHTIVATGLIIFLFYIIALIFFFITHMYERTYMPFYLIMQTFFYLGFMTLGRFGFGIEYGMASRYTCVSLYGLVALVWISIFTLTTPSIAKRRWRVVFFFPPLLIFFGVLLTAIVEWHIQPYRKAYSANLHDIAVRVDTATPEELAKFEERPDLVRDSLRLLRKYKLNAYRPVSGLLFDFIQEKKQLPPIGNNLKSLRSCVLLDREDYKYINGVYAREDNWRWASPEVHILLWRTNQNMVSAEVTVPEGLLGFKSEHGNKNAVKLHLVAKGCAKSTLDIPKQGHYLIEAPITCSPIPAGAPFEIILSLNSQLDPHEIVPDVRILSFQLHKIELK